MFDNLKELCLLNGTSGNEDAVREYIINEIKDYAEYHIDNLGNIIASALMAIRSSPDLLEECC